MKIFVWVIIIVVVGAVIADRPLSRRREKKEKEAKEAARAAELQKEQEAREAERQRQAAIRQEREEAFSRLLDAIPSVEIVPTEEPAPHRKLGDMPEYDFTNVTKRTSREKLGNFVSFDVETTGLQPTRAEIVEIAAVRFRGFQPVAKFVTLCEPRKGIDPEAAKINKITEELVTGKPSFEYIAGPLRDFIGDDNVVGHNLEFDLRFLWRYGVDLFSDEKRRFYDTYDLASRTLKNAKYKYDREIGGRVIDYEKDYDVDNYKLGTLCSYYGIPLCGAHRALADAYATGLLLEKIAEDRA